MTKPMISLTILLLSALVAAPSVGTAREEATQTDWSGGPGIEGPVTEWEIWYAAG